MATHTRSVNVHLAKEIYDRDAGKLSNPRCASNILADMKDVIVIKATQTLLIGAADPYTANMLRIPAQYTSAEAHWNVVRKQ